MPHAQPHHGRHRPLGQHTRGKTAENRLRQVDVFVALALGDVLRAGAPLVIDLGFGARPWTALEMAERLRHLNPRLRLLGVEIDAGRVAEAQALAIPPRVEFALGGFDLARVAGPAAARLVRAMNVLRQYDESAVQAALIQTAKAIEPGGVLVEGTSTPTGAMVVFDVWRRDPEAEPLGLTHEALVFASNFRGPHAPADYQTILPKRLIHRMPDPEPARFFADWTRAAEIARGAAARGGVRERWVLVARELRERFGWPIDPRERLIERGYLVLRADLRGASASG
jgi:hypothetical protein